MRPDRSEHTGLNDAVTRGSIDSRDRYLGRVCCIFHINGVAFLWLMFFYFNGLERAPNITEKFTPFVLSVFVSTFVTLD